MTNLPHSADQVGLGNRNHVDFASGLVGAKGRGFYIPMQTVRKITAGKQPLHKIKINVYKEQNQRTLVYSIADCTSQPNTLDLGPQTALVSSQRR